MLATIEEWRVVPDRQGIRVSDQGNVMRYKHGKWVRIAPAIGDNGYQNVDGSGVHVLVLEAFVGPRPTECHVARHVMSRLPSDNRLKNLAWGTHHENRIDQRRHDDEDQPLFRTKRPPMQIKVAPWIKAAIETVATRNRRTISAQVILILERIAMENGIGPPGSDDDDE